MSSAIPGFGAEDACRRLRKELDEEQTKRKALERKLDRIKEVIANSCNKNQAYDRLFDVVYGNID